MGIEVILASKLEVKKKCNSSLRFVSGEEELSSSAGKVRSTRYHHSEGEILIPAELAKLTESIISRLGVWEVCGRASRGFWGFWRVLGKVEFLGFGGAKGR